MTTDHPFAQYVRALGKGPNMWRNLSFDEAKDAMSLILQGSVDRLQLGAFLLLLRRKGETGEELAGMTAAAREAFIGQPSLLPDVDYDWPSYADRHRQQPWFILAALLLADQGYKILMHGIEGYSDGLAPTRPGLDMLNVPMVSDFGKAAKAFETNNLVYIGLEKFCPAVQDLFELRPLLGVRTAVNTFGRDLNPANAPYQMQGVFHPPYKAMHVDTARFLGQPKAMVFKGGGGEVMRNPMKPSRVDMLVGEVSHEIVWPALTTVTTYKWREEDLSPTQLKKMWNGSLSLPVPELGIIGTLAVALKMALPDLSPTELDARATDIWQTRDKMRFD
ncbi:glycosyl transferase family protein [Sneathiella aquimaris]|uniref:glycosyl transferase family protein n=1 Tax=Sneathiella aquimaris TaxID=2599305 RepID=UPI00146E526F|nr:glycosyl transferase family protein [Sneathiella aquimaris]